LVQKNEFLSSSLNEERETLQKRIDDILKEKNKIEKQAIMLTHQKEEAVNIAKAKD
jgi:ABC-type nitrate/sulfonate/bicarbonate transport system ATPase subunit